VYQSLYCYTVIGTLAVGGWAVTFGTARRGLGSNSPPINGQCTNFVLFDVALQLPVESKGLNKFIEIFR